MTSKLLYWGIPFSVFILASSRLFEKGTSESISGFHDIAEEEMLSSCANFIDTNCQWSTEYSNFLVGNTNPELPSLKIMRLQDDFVTSKGKQIPVMRIVSIFPKIHPETIYDLLTDCTLRLQWDTNYMMFEKLNSTLKHDIKVPIDIFTPFFKTTILGGSWFQHCVGSAFLSKIGVENRQFLYYRWCVRHEIPRQYPDKFLKGFTIIYDGSEKRRMAVLKPDEEQKTSPAHIQCNMNYQHIVLLPISDINAQISDRSFTDIEQSGSFLHVNSISSLCDLFRKSCEKRKTTSYGQEGTLFMITSVNDIGVPRGLPKWAEKKVSSLISTKVYNNLMKAAYSYQNTN